RATAHLRSRPRSPRQGSFPQRPLPHSTPLKQPVPADRRYAPGHGGRLTSFRRARMTRHRADIDRSEEWAELRARHLEPADQRPSSSARGVHHLALLSRDVERTITFYQDLLEFPLTDLFENRDYEGSTHFFFDIGHGNLLAFFDLPGLDLDVYAEVLGGLHHLAISVEPERWEYLKAKLEAAGIVTQQASGSAPYFQGPAGQPLALIKDRLGEMYGTTVACPRASAHPLPSRAAHRCPSSGSGRGSSTARPLTGQCALRSTSVTGSSTRRRCIGTRSRSAGRSPIATSGARISS